MEPFSSGVSLTTLKVLFSFQFHSPFPLIWGSPNLGRRRYMAGLLPSRSSSLSAVSPSLAPGQSFELEEVLEVEGKTTKTWVLLVSLHDFCRLKHLSHWNLFAFRCQVECEALSLQADLFCTRKKCCSKFLVEICQTKPFSHSWHQTHGTLHVQPLQALGFAAASCHTMGMVNVHARAMEG